MTEEAIENIVRAQWQKVDDLIDKYKKKCDQAKVNNGMIIHSKISPFLIGSNPQGNSS